MPKIAPLMLLPPLVFLGLAALFLIGMQRDDPNALPSAREGQLTPGLKLVDFDGSEITEDMLRSPGVKLVNFWASWCAPCRAEHPNLEALNAQGMPIYGINYRDDTRNAQAFLRELGDPFESIGSDPSARTALDWGVYGVPETFLIDGEGRVLRRIAGPLTQRVMEKSLTPALEAVGWQPE